MEIVGKNNFSGLPGGNTAWADMAGLGSIGTLYAC